MTAPGQYASQDGSFARSAGGAAGRGIVLIAIAVVIGLVLLAKGFDGADTVAGSTDAGTSADEPATGDESSEPADETDTSEPADETDTSEPADETVTEPDAPRPPSEVKVAAVNATGAPGVAGRATGILDTQGYITQAKNATTNLDVSAVYYQAGYAEDAKAVAAILQIPADLIGPAPPDVVDRIENNENVADFHIFIFQGADGLAGV